MQRTLYILAIIPFGFIASYVEAGGLYPRISNSVKNCSQLRVSQDCAKTMSSVFDIHGRLWSAWVNGQYLYVNYSDDKGLTFSQAVKVNAVAEKIAAGREHRPKIKVSDAGLVFLSWTKKLAKRFTGDIRFSRSVDGGKSFTVPVTVNDNREIISHRFDVMGVNKKGDIYISWLDKRDKQKAARANREYNGAAVYFSASFNGGKSFTQNKKIADNSCECCRMAMDFDQQALPVISWRHIYGDNIRDHSMVNFKNKMEADKPFRLSYDNWKIKGCPHHGPSISIGKHNVYHAVWFNNAEKRHGIFYANSHNKGKTFSSTLQVGSYTNKASHADILAVGKQVYIVWQEYLHPHYKMFMQKSVDKGNNWDEPVLITETSRTPDYPFLLTDGQAVFASWHIPGQTYRLILLR